MANHADIQVVVIEGRGKPMNSYLGKWLERFPNRWIVRPPYVDHMVMYRNQAVRDFLGKTSLSYVLMLDDDMLAVAETEGIVTSDEPICGCRYYHKSGQPLHADGIINCGCLRLHRSVLAAIGEPYFRHEFNPAFTEVTACECQQLSRRAKAAGFDPKYVGIIGHIVPMGILPDGDRFKIHLL